jgi:hypothetical protein
MNSLSKKYISVEVTILENRKCFSETFNWKMDFIENIQTQNRTQMYGATATGYVRQPGYYEQPQAYAVQQMPYGAYQFQYSPGMGIYQVARLPGVITEAQLVHNQNQWVAGGAFPVQQQAPRAERAMHNYGSHAPAPSTEDPGHRVARSTALKYTELDVNPACALPDAFHKEVPGCFYIIGRGNLPSMCFRSERLCETAGRNSEF